MLSYRVHDVSAVLHTQNDPRKPFRDVRFARVVHQKHEGKCSFNFFFYPTLVRRSCVPCIGEFVERFLRKILSCGTRRVLDDVKPVGATDSYMYRQ